MKHKRKAPGKSIRVQWHASKHQTEFLLVSDDGVYSLGFAQDASEARKILASLKRKYILPFDIRPGAIRT